MGEVKPVKCRYCETKSVTNKTRVGWLRVLTDGIAVVDAATTNNLYCNIVTAGWYCSIDCLNALIWEKYDDSKKKTKKLIKQVRKEKMIEQRKD